MSTHSDRSESPALFYYRITRNEDGLLDFTPPEHSEELRDALHFKFPSEHDYTSRIQKAILEFHGYSTTEEEKLDYFLSRNDVGYLEFTPKAGSTELREALHYHFPEEKDHNSRIRRAICAYHHRKATVTSLEGPLLERTDTASSKSSVRTLTRQGSTSSSKAPSGQGRKPRRGNNTRRKFNPIERKQIADVRGHVCSTHKDKHLKCDPYVCKDNDLHEEYVARKLETERREGAHAALLFDGDSIHQNRITSGDRNFPPYTTTSFYASQPDLHTSYQCLPGILTGYLGVQPANASFASLPNMQTYLPTPGEANGYYQDTLPIPPIVPSNGSPIIQNTLNTESPVNNTNYENFNLNASPNNDVWNWQNGMRDQSTDLSSVPDKPIPKPTKSGPLAALRKTFDRLFRNRRVATET